MLLSKLELNGFKSFPYDTALQFDEGIMGVVGPNGCGKTNILDSLRWVLGEQRSSVLRGSRVEEVLFNGTSQLRSMDMAEVNLTIKNNRGVLPLEYDEVVVTRRLYRSGESEYLINKSRCRLKDIVDLFSDTGMGTHAYSIFQQSMIDSVLSDKADERRFLFEEASGITKYKNRKKEALKKLENTEVDLVRLNDIIAEITKNVRSLKRQATKVKRLKNVKEELQNLQVVRAQARMHELMQAITGHSTKINEFKADKASLKANSDREDITIEELKLNISGLNEKMSSKMSSMTNLSEQAIRVENDLSNIQANLDSGKKNVGLWKEEIDSLQARIESLKKEKEQAIDQHTTSSAELDSLRTELVSDEEKTDSLKYQIEKLESELNEIKEILHKHENKIVALQTQQEAVNGSIKQLNDISRDIEQSLSQYREKKETSQAHLEHQKNILKDCEDSILENEKMINANQQEHLSLLSKVDDIRKDISTTNSKMSATEAKIEMLSKMVLEHEGYGSGVKSLFAWQDRPEGVIDTIANLITAEKKYHNAVEAAMNKYGQLVVCNNRTDALECIDFLNKNSAGRVSFLILDRVQSLDVDPVVEETEGFIDCAAGLVASPDYLSKAVKILFSDIAVFESGKIPQDYKGEAVDLDGSYYSSKGIVQGGKSSVLLIGRKSELTDLQDDLDNVQQSLTSLEKELAENKETLQQIDNRAVKLNDEKKLALKKREQLISDMTRLEFEFKDSISWLEKLSSNSFEIEKQFENLNQQKAEIEKQVSDENTKKREISEIFENESNNLKQFQNNFESAVNELNNKRLKVVELSSYLQKLDDDSRRFSEMIDEANNMISQKMKMVDDEQNSWQELESRQERTKDNLAKIFETRDKVNQEKDELSNEKNMLAERLNESEIKIKNLRIKIGNINDSIHLEELAFSDMNNKLLNLKENIFNEYGIHVDGVRNDDYNEEQVNTEIERFENMVEKMGPVNMLADEEYNTEKDRLEFLEKQYKDLLDAKTSLKEVIKKINKTAEDKFSETFEFVKENFQEVFETLFNGGVAELKLTDPDNLLETPIEIVARPGGKKLVSVNQLSGGERALTAISLLFAIYMVKPSPFCILDEIDAPLDDANVNRFIKLINKFTSSTQFIVITHNKKTMEATDLLYGVTMEQPGVSRIVSVKLNGNRIENA